MNDFTGHPDSFLDRRMLLVRLLFLIFFIFVINIVAMRFAWYWSLWWFDMFMHFIGGLWVVSMFIWLSLFSPSRFFKKLKNFRQILTLSFIVVLFIGIGWELFEFSLDKLVLSYNMTTFLDTISDIFFDLSGGMFGIFYFLMKSRR